MLILLSLMYFLLSLSCVIITPYLLFITIASLANAKMKLLYRLETNIRLKPILY